MDAQGGGMEDYREESYIWQGDGDMFPPTVRGVAGGGGTDPTGGLPQEASGQGSRLSGH